MGHTPFGYKIDNGIAVIDQPAADKLRQLYKNYLSGMSLSKAASAAGIKTYHGTAKRLMETAHYLGDSFYPAIIDKDTYQKAQEERKRRATALGRNNKQTQMRKLQIPTHFHMNIPVLFEKESINTMDAKGEVLITIMASLAQQESQSLSQNVKMGLQYRYQQGKVQINHNRFLGYTKDADGNLVIDPEQAETVKRIYREYLEGLSMDKIAAGLERDGILTGAGGKKWHTSTINKILRNEKYIGDALLQKTYTTDFLNKTRVKNNGLVPQYYVEGDHEAIIPKDIYLQVQEELVRRRVGKTSANGKKRNYSCNHCFSQIVICGECGEMFRRLHWNNRGVKSIVWRCISRLESTGLECHARTINELVLQDAVVKAINQMLGDKSNYQAQLQLNIAAVIRASQATAIDSIDEKLMALQQELIQKANSKEDYDEIADEIFRLRELRQKTTVDTAARDEQIKRINDLQDYISQQTSYLTEFDEALVRRWIKQITIWDDRITVELKSGVSIDVDA